MTEYEPRNPGWRKDSARAFHDQALMQTLGVELAEHHPGRATLIVAFNPAFAQQHGFLHAGATTSVIDTACGVAAMSLMPAGAEVLTAEFKVSLLAPARGAQFRCEGRVVKPGRTLVFTEGTVWAEDEDTAPRLVATMTATMMAVTGRADIAPALPADPASKW